MSVAAERTPGSPVPIVVPAILVMLPMIAAAWLPAEFPLLWRQVLLCAWGVGATRAAERIVFSRSASEALRAVGFAPPRPPVVVAALIASLPMWAFLPMLALSRGAGVGLRPDWLPVLLGVMLVNGLAEEVLHRGFVFGRLRRMRSFASAAAVSAAVFGAQHLYLILTMGWMVGGASVLLAVCLAFPLAFAFERGGNSIGAPAVLHTSSNAPVLVFSLPPDVLAVGLLPHMAVVLASLYGLFALRGRL